MQRISVMMPVLIKSDKHLAMTMKCLDHARKNTKLPFELVIVETGSQYLIDEADIYVYEKEITTPENSHNKGFKVATGEYIVLLTNDVFVGEEWLEKMLECFRLPWCGLATIGSKNNEKRKEIKEDYWFDVAMIRKEVFDRAGYYDERFIGSWPDSDLLVRAYKLGYKMYRNFDCIANGDETQTTVGLHKDHKYNYEIGRELFRKKHENCGLPIYDLLK